MSRYCHECNAGVQNPFYVMSLGVVDRENDRIAFSNLEVSLCAEEFAKIEGAVRRSLDEVDGDILYVLDAATGWEGGVTGAVQLCHGYGQSGDVRYIAREDVARLLPKSAEDLLKKHRGLLEPTGGGFVQVDWAQEIYDRVCGE